MTDLLLMKLSPWCVRTKHGFRSTRSGLKVAYVSLMLAMMMAIAPQGRADDLKDPERLAVELRPVAGSKKIGNDDAVRLRDRVIRIIEFLEKSHRSSRAPAKDLLHNSFNWHLKDEMSSKRIFATQYAILKCWESARRLGVFDDNGDFQPIIRNGPDKGEECVFEYIIPVNLAPEFSTDPMNFRITSPGERRKGKGKELSEAEQKYFTGMKTLAEEALYGDRDEFGNNAKDLADLWKQEVKAAGEAFHEKPHVKVNGRMGATPTLSNEHRWRLDAFVTNISDHPTVVEVEYYFLGIAKASTRHFVMMKGRETVKLRELEIWEKEYWTDSRKQLEPLAKRVSVKEGEEHKKKRRSKKKDDEEEKEKDPLYVRRRQTDSSIEFIQRGWIILVKYEGELVGQAMSGYDMLKYVKWDQEDLHILPAYTGPEK